jgi:signal transduction histidine kinase
VSLTNLVETIAADARFEAANPNRSVHVDLADDLTINGSKEMLRQAIENVVGNAVRYTAEHSRWRFGLADRPTSAAIMHGSRYGTTAQGCSPTRSRGCFCLLSRCRPA